MKILAIRGQNLASLSNAFEIDFRREPLASAGLFAITGPTGSGKSTLLDALCIALYERTPRLGKAPNRNETIPDVGDERISPSDPRTLLRRGSGEGWAEVDFVGSDGIPYRAQWSVRRARGRATGRLQASEMSLLRLSDQQVLSAGHKTDTLKLIETRIGLSYEQFTRAVLLAQNDFATFLKASNDERAELLQTLTGTETFTLISQRAFARMKEEQGRLQGLEQQLQAIAPLLPQQRADKEIALADACTQLKALEARKQEAESRLRWYRQLTRLRADEAEARSAVDAAAAARQEAEGRAVQLTRVARVQPARPLIAELDRLQGARQAASATLVQARDALAAARQQVESGAAQATAAAHRADTREQELTAAQPALNEARTLDGALSVAGQHVQAAVSAHEAACAEQAQAMQALAESQQQRTRTGQALDAAQAWLHRHAALQALAQNWAAWDTHLKRARQLRDQGMQLESARTEARNQLSRVDAALSAARTRHTDAQAAFAGARRALDAQIATVQAFDAEALAAARRTVERRRERVTEAARLWQRLQERRSQLHRLQQEQTALAEKLLQANTRHAALIADRPAQQVRLEMARDLLARARLAASEQAESMRALLEADRPCPVCGSVDHPYAMHSPREKAMLDSLQAAEEEARQTLAGTDNELHALAARIEADAGTLERNRTGQLALSTELETEETRWHSHVGEDALGEELAGVAEQDRAAWIDDEGQRRAVELAALDEQGGRHREALRLRDLARTALDAAQAEAEQADRACVQLETEHKNGLAEQARLSANGDALGRQLDDTLHRLDAAFADPGWRAAWADDADAFVTRCAAQAEQWTLKQAEREALSHELVQIDSTMAARHQAAELLARRVETLSGQRSSAQAGLDGLTARRAALLGGRAVSAVDNELAAALNQARTDREQARQAHQAALTACAQCETASHQAAALVGQLDDASKHAGQQLQAWIAGLPADDAVTGETLRQLLVHDDSWLAREREALAGLDRALSSAQAVLDARRTTRLRHEADQPAADEAAHHTADDTDSLQATLDGLTTQLEAASTLLGTLKVELARDDGCRQEAEALRERIERQQGSARVWAQLNELIGSADGRKFRNFAQQLTLDILLGYANRHLESLARRYRLMRIEDSLGLLVIDQEMGDETRSVHSLSGGESFLVSLALALGLASLSSHRVSVESLFIDEGFGSLDADALNVAMAALDKLQAQGRKVGIISHVQEMTERIGTRIQVSRQTGGSSQVALSWS